MTTPDSDLPQGNSLLGPEEVSGLSFNELSARLADLELKIGDKELGWEDQYREKLLTEVDQRIKVRWAAVLLAVFALVVMLLFALVGFQAVSSSATAGTGIGALKVGLFIAPIASITAIMAILLVGVFKRHSDENDKVDLPALATEIGKAFQQN